MSEWTEKLAGIYDPKPYLHAFTLEWMMLGECPLLATFMKKHRTAQCPYRERRPSPTPGECEWIIERWYKAEICGPWFVEKYHIPIRKEGDAT